MSLFLGPIHYWLYNKIQVQQDFVDKITEMDKIQWHLNLEAICNEKFGQTERHELAHVIDEGNIHGWLQNQVAITEYKLAYCVTEILKKDITAMAILKSIFEEMGTQKRSSIKEDMAPISLFQVIQDTLLDGMPCDHVNEVVEQSEEKVVWRRNSCVHKSYWEAVGGNVKHYYYLREAWLSAFIGNKAIKFEQIDEVTYVLKKVI